MNGDPTPLPEEKMPVPWPEFRWEWALPGPKNGPNESKYRPACPECDRDE